MALDITGILAAVESHARKLGVFQDVLTGEPKPAPGSGVYAAIWAQNIRPAAAGSGLSKVSPVLLFTVRVMKHMLALPYGTIDSDMLSAADALMREYAGSFTLGGLVRHVDLLGAYGTPMEGNAGYVNLDKATLRVIDISLPLVVDDLWDEVP